MSNYRLGDILCLGVGIPKLDGPIAAAGYHIPLLKDFFIEQATNLPLVGIEDMPVGSNFVVLRLREFLP